MSILAPFTSFPHLYSQQASRPNRVHVVLHDCGLQAIPGAQLALDRLSPETRELTLSHNLLTSSGVIHLFRGLIRLRTEWATSVWSSYPVPSFLAAFPSSQAGISLGKPNSGPEKKVTEWALTKLTLNSNRIDDAALEVIAEFLEGDRWMEELYLAGNQITGGTEMTRLGLAVTKSNLKVLSFNNNLLTSPSLSHLLSSLTPPLSDPITPSPKPHTLTDLHLSSNPLTKESLPSLLTFLLSQTHHPPTSPTPTHALQLLALNATQLGWPSVLLLQAAAHWNTTLEVGVQVGSCWVWEGFTGGSWDPWGIEEFSITPPVGQVAPGLPQELAFGQGQAHVEGQGLQLGVGMDEEPMGSEGDLRRGLEDLMQWEEEISQGIMRAPNPSWAPGQATYLLKPFPTHSRLPPHLSSYTPILPTLLAPHLASPSPLTHAQLDILSRQILTMSTNSLSRIAERNRALKDQVLKCALGVLPGARVILGGRRASDGEVGRGVMQSFGLGKGLGGLETPPSSQEKGGEYFRGLGISKEMEVVEEGYTPPFRLLDLPSDLIPQILIHLQPSPYLLSAAQMTSILAYASSPLTLRTELASMQALHLARSASGHRIALGPGGPRGFRSQGVRAGPGHFGRADWAVVVALGDDRGSKEQREDMKKGGVGGWGGVWGDEREVVDRLMVSLGVDRWDGE